MMGVSSTTASTSLPRSPLGTFGGSPRRWLSTFRPSATTTRALHHRSSRRQTTCTSAFWEAPKAPPPRRMWGCVRMWTRRGKLGLTARKPRRLPHVLEAWRHAFPSRSATTPPRSPPQTNTATSGRWLNLQTKAGPVLHPRTIPLGAPTKRAPQRELGAESCGYTVLGVSKDPANPHKFIDKHGLGFDLLCDEELNVHHAFGVWAPRNSWAENSTARTGPRL